MLLGTVLSSCNKWLTFKELRSSRKKYPPRVRDYYKPRMKGKLILLGDVLHLLFWWIENYVMNEYQNYKKVNEYKKLSGFRIENIFTAENRNVDKCSELLLPLQIVGRFDKSK